MNDMHREGFESWYRGRFTRDGKCFMGITSLEPSCSGDYKAAVQECYEGWCGAMRYRDDQDKPHD